MPLATLDPYLVSPNSTSSTVITLGIYIFTVFALALILLHLHCCFITHSPFSCHTSQPLSFTSISTHPHLTLSLSGSVSSQCLRFMPSILSSLLLSPSSSLLKDFLATKQMSLANSMSNSFITLHSHKSSTLELAQTIYLISLVSHFTPSFHFYLDQSLSCLFLVSESSVLGLAKDCNQTGLRPNKTKTERNHLLVFCSLGLGFFFLEKSKRPKKTGLALIIYILTTILGVFLVILLYLFGIYLYRFSLTRECSTCHPEMWISPSFLGQIT